MDETEIFITNVKIKDNADNESYGKFKKQKTIVINEKYSDNNAYH